MWFVVVLGMVTTVLKRTVAVFVTVDVTVTVAVC
jgi:hypothetical protein